MSRRPCFAGRLFDGSHLMSSLLTTLSVVTRRDMNDKRFKSEFKETVENYLTAHNITRAALAERIHISPQLLSEILNLNGTKAITLETKLKLLHFMDNQNNDTECLEKINQAVLKRFASKGMRIEHFQSGLGLGEDGFVPREGADTEPDFAETVSQLLKDGRYQEAQDILAQISKNARTHSTATKATVNREGVTQVVTVKGGKDGRAASWVGTQSLDCNGGILNVDAKGLLEFCRKDVNKSTADRTAKSHKPVELPEVKFKNKTFFNTDGVNVNMEDLGQRHNQSLLADKDLYAANLQRIAERAARLARKQQGKANLDDLRTEYNSRRQ